MTQRPNVLKKPIARLLTKFSEEELSISILDYLSDKYTNIIKEKSLFRALIICTVHFFLIFTSLIINKFIWSIIMFKNYLKIMIRHLLRHKGYTFINIFGFSTGLACCIFIYLYVNYETGYDSFFKDADRIFRIIASVDSPTGKTIYAGAPHQLTLYIKENFPQVEYIAKVTPWRNDEQVKYGSMTFNETALNIPFADEDIFKIFSYRFIEGNPNTALMRPKTAVLTEQTAQKYFGKENPVGKVLSIGEAEYEITGIIENLPGNTSFRFNMLRSWSTLDHSMFYPRWMNFHLTFVKLAAGQNPGGFARLITGIITDHAKEDLESRSSEYTSILQPIRQVHLNSKDFTFERSNTGNKLYIYVFSGIGILILLIASINFVNLITARSSNRACEVGMRKLAGAHRKQLFSQFIGESLIMTAVSFLTAFSAVFILLNKFNELAQIQIEYSNLIQPGFILLIISAIFVLGIAAGSYPALFLSSFKPISVLRGTINLGIKGKSMRKILVVGQFALSITMIIGVILFSSQLDYMKNRPLGFEKEQKLIINMQETDVGSGNYISIKEEFAGYPSVIGAAFSTGIPGRRLYHARLWPTGQQHNNSHNVNWINADKDFISVYGLTLIAGKNITDKEGTNQLKVHGIFNETAVRTFGWTSPEEAVNTTFRDNDPKGLIIGVVRDFHFTGLQKKIEPLVILFREGYRYLTLKINTENLNETLEGIGDKFKSLFPGVIFEYFFLDADFNRQYQREERTAKIFAIFTFLGILIAGLGLISLAAFIAEQRTKEIGIRKAMGATAGSVLYLITKEFLYLVTAANIIAWPVTYFVMDKWLHNFAYRISIGITAFIYAGLIALMITLISVGYQSLKAAYKNPVDSLKYE